MQQTVSLSNLQRQVLFRTADIGRPKVDAGAQALDALNPGVRVQAHGVRLTAANVMDLIGSYDIVADGSDNFATRFLLNDACYFAKKVLVSAAVTEFEGQLATYKGHEAGCPCYRCLFPEPPPPGTAPSCSETGVLGAAAPRGAGEGNHGTSFFQASRTRGDRARGTRSRIQDQR